MRVAIAEDSALFRSGLKLLLTAMHVDVIVEASNGLDLLTGIALDTPDVVILDIRMPPSFTDEGLVVADELRRRYPTLGILLLSTYADAHYAARLLANGSNGVGYLLKDRVDDPETLRDALVRVANRGCVVDPELVARLLARQQKRSIITLLTDRERDVLRLMAEGLSNQGIGQLIFVSPRTVEKHIAAVFSKLGLPPGADENRRVLAVLAWLRETTDGMPN
jgi:DNA-binding NarL/FixJ family response regulator